MAKWRWPARAGRWLGRPVRLGAVQVGVVADLVANERLGHVLGFEVRGNDACGRFLPWIAADVDGRDVQIRSVYSLLSPAELAVYLERGRRVSEQDCDLLVDRYGDVAEIVPLRSAVASGDGMARRRPAA